MQRRNWKAGRVKGSFLSTLQSGNDEPRPRNGLLDVKMSVGQNKSKFIVPTLEWQLRPTKASRTRGSSRPDLSQTGGTRQAAPGRGPSPRSMAYDITPSTPRCHGLRFAAQPQFYATIGSFMSRSLPLTPPNADTARTFPGP